MKFVKDGHTIEEWIEATTADANKIMNVDDYRPVAIRVYIVSEKAGGSSSTIISDESTFYEYFSEDDGGAERR